jgi:hypothetical protein
VDGLELNDTAEREGVPYGSADLKRLQCLDYIMMLRAEIEGLLETPWSWETDNRIREVRTEMYKLMRGTKVKFEELKDGSIMVQSSASGADDVEPGRR